MSNKTLNWKSDWHVQSSEAIAKEMNEKGQTKVVSYDSSRSIANKVRYAVRKDLGGVMVWSIDTDDFRGDCEREEDTYADFRAKPGVKLMMLERTSKNYPLLRTLNEAIEISQDEKTQEAQIEKDKENEIEHSSSTSSTPTKDGSPSVASQIVQSLHSLLIVAIFSRFL